MMGPVETGAKDEQKTAPQPLSGLFGESGVYKSRNSATSRAPDTPYATSGSMVSLFWGDRWQLVDAEYFS